MTDLLIITAQDLNTIVEAEIATAIVWDAITREAEAEALKASTPNQPRKVK